MANTRFKTFRISRGLTQADMAKKLGVTPSAYAMYERGEREPSMETIISISNILQVDINVLLGIKNPPPTEIISDGERMIIDLFRQIPVESQESAIEMLRSALKVAGILE